MFGRKVRPVIHNLITGASGSGYRPNVVTSPRSPLDFKNYGGAVGVGLGIVAALENIETGSCLQAGALYNKSVPISGSYSTRKTGNTEEDDGDNLEDYSYVTSYGPNKNPHTRVYYGGCKNSNHRACVFHICPETSGTTVESSARQNFLSSCHMCHKTLHGRDIYMYRGEKAYCSTECRERQIVMDEKKQNKWISQASVAHLSTSPCSTNDRQMFTTGIFAI